MFELRRMTLADIPDALLLWRGMPGITLRDADSPEMLGRYLDRNPDLSVVAQGPGRVIGVALAGHDGRRGFLHHVAVHEDHRRRGVGRAMVDDCVARLAGQGIAKTLIFVNAENDEGKIFWLRLGWEIRPGLEVMTFSTAGETA